MAQQSEQETGGTGLGHRSVTMTRTEKGTYLVTNVRGGTLSVGGGGESADFTPVELFLTVDGGVQRHRRRLHHEPDRRAGRSST